MLAKAGLGFSKHILFFSFATLNITNFQKMTILSIYMQTSIFNLVTYLSESPFKICRACIMANQQNFVIQTVMM